VLSRRRVSGTVGQATRTDRLCAVPETRVTASSRRPTGSGTAAPGADLAPPFPAEAGGHARLVSRFLSPLLHVFSSRSLRGLGRCLAEAAGWLTCGKPGSGVAAARSFRASCTALHCPQRDDGGVMVWIGGPRRDPGDRLGRGRRGLYLHDPPPGYHPPQPRMPLKDRQRIARQDWILEHVLAVILILSAAAVILIICLILATHH
jgi:hypothetical protein